MPVGERLHAALRRPRPLAALDVERRAGGRPLRLHPRDARASPTLDAIIGGLDRNGLIDRHDPEQDSSTDPCAPFLFPTCWLSEALQQSGRDGSRHFAAAVSARGSLDLFGEVADPNDNSPLGNYPQVQSHASFLLAATTTPTSR